MASDDGWSERGYLPHYHCAGTVQFVTLHLADSLPGEVAASHALTETDADRRRRYERLLDAGHGECLLRGATADLVVDVLRSRDGQDYNLLAWVVMPNHVHVLVEPLGERPLAAIVSAWKHASAHQVNARHARHGRLWQREYFDRYVRDEEHLATCLRYIHANPVKAGLVQREEDWRWSSASR